MADGEPRLPLDLTGRLAPGIQREATVTRRGVSGTPRRRWRICWSINSTAAPRGFNRHVFHARDPFVPQFQMKIDKGDMIGNFPANFLDHHADKTVEADDHLRSGPFEPFGQSFSHPIHAGETIAKNGDPMPERRLLPAVERGRVAEDIIKDGRVVLIKNEANALVASLERLRPAAAENMKMVSSRAMKGGNPRCGLSPPSAATAKRLQSIPGNDLASKK